MVIEAEELKKILSQAEPFILIDRVIEFEKDKRLIAIKNITGNEWVFEGAEGESTAFPETLIIEAAAQAGLMFYYLNSPQKSAPVYLAKIDSAFEEQAFIGDQIILTTGRFKFISTQGFIDVNVRTGTQKIGEVNIFYSLIEGTVPDKCRGISGGKKYKKYCLEKGRFE